MVSEERPRSSRYARAAAASSSFSSVLWKNMAASRCRAFKRSATLARWREAPGAASVTPARSASDRSASPNGTPSRRMTKLKMSPPVPQAPKQCHDCRSGLTKKDGVRSEWNGQGALKLRPDCLSGVVSPTSPTMSILALISSAVDMLAPYGLLRSFVRLRGLSGGRSQTSREPGEGHVGEPPGSVSGAPISRNPRVISG